jgi:hypothetical protein
MSDSNQLAGAVQDAINITHLEASVRLLGKALLVCAAL